MSINAATAWCQRAEVVTRTDREGRLWAECLMCRQKSKLTTHRPIVEQWRKAHARGAA